jgi:hypothetical protein
MLHGRSQDCGAEWKWTTNTCGRAKVVSSISSTNAKLNARRTFQRTLILEALGAKEISCAEQRAGEAAPSCRPPQSERAAQTREIAVARESDRIGDGDKRRAA